MDSTGKRNGAWSAAKTIAIDGLTSDGSKTVRDSASNNAPQEYWTHLHRILSLPRDRRVYRNPDPLKATVLIWCMAAYYSRDRGSLRSEKICYRASLTIFTSTSRVS